MVISLKTAFYNALNRVKDWKKQENTVNGVQDQRGYDCSGKTNNIINCFRDFKV